MTLILKKYFKMFKKKSLMEKKKAALNILLHIMMKMILLDLYI